MRIIIDADACPVTRIATDIAKQRSIEVIYVFDTSHFFDDEYAKCVLVDKGRDCADIVLANLCTRNDICITQDYGLASMCLAKGARVIHQDGWEYTQYNIDALLFQRHASREYRASGGRTKGPSKRKKSQNQDFFSAFQKLLEEERNEYGKLRFFST